VPPPFPLNVYSGQRESSGVQVLREPDVEAALAFLRTELAGLLERSDLSRGERLVLLKPDGTLLVHTAEKAKPVNWQPPGASFSVGVEGGRIVLTSTRLKPEEMVQVTFHSLQLLLAVPLRDAAELALVGSEDDLQQLLFTDPDLVEIGFVPQRRERDSARGFYDLDGRDSMGRRMVVEVKRATAGVSEAQQLWRYVERLRRDDASVRGILVAPRVADKARRMLGEHGLEWRELDWATLLPKVQAMRATGQASLGRFA
jgi:endonuclease